MFTSKQLNTVEINTFLYSTLPSPLKQTFVGCFPCDLIPWTKLLQYKVCALIANTAQSDSNGEHFIAIVRVYNNVIMWDSFGLKQHYDIFKDYAARFCNMHNFNLWINTNQYQHINSNACGYFVIWFVLSIYYNLFNINIDQILNNLSKTDYIENECRIYCQIEMFMRFFILQYPRIYNKS